MATYAVGDIQGCFDELQALLEQVGFDVARDCLWLAGDLVNRGPHSLATLRFVRGLGDAAVTVLGNHDLHLIALAYGIRTPHRGDTLDEILAAPDRDELLEWLMHQPLVHRADGYVLVHAGLPPQWHSAQAVTLAAEVSAALTGADPMAFLRQMYGNTPDCWDEGLTGVERLRYITNALTRMRFITADGRLDLAAKGAPDAPPSGCMPWYEVPRATPETILFGHWAASGLLYRPDTVGLDTGCVWGECLTAMRLEDRRIFQVPSRQPRRSGND